jgi:DNA-binding GntR family transcriptional regulator
MVDSLTEHRAILAAIRLRDAERAAQLTADHIRVPAQRLQAELEDELQDDDNPEANDSELASA